MFNVQYLSVVTRSDISYAVSNLSQYVQNPNKPQWNAVTRVFKYIKGTGDYGIMFNTNNNLEMCAYSEADFAGDTMSRRSTTRYVIKLVDSVLIWGSRKQTSIAQSTILLVI